jgi:hypothetical protein
LLGYSLLLYNAIPFRYPSVRIRATHVYLRGYRVLWAYSLPPGFQRPSCCFYNCDGSCGEIAKHSKIPSAKFWQFEFLRLKGSFK